MWHTCALTIEGRVKCWGYPVGAVASDGGLPDASAVPVDVAGLDPGVTAIAAGSVGGGGAADGDNCAVTGEGAVQCWGRNVYGQLGNDTTFDSPAPVRVSGLTGAKAVAAGWEHSCALTLGGGVTCWGSGFVGQLGDGSRNSSLTPVPVEGASSGIAAIGAGMTHNCALTLEGGVRCWGEDLYGQLGIFLADNRSLVPVDVPGLGSNVTAIGVGEAHTCAVNADGGVVCWGNNGHGQCGNGVDAHSFSAVEQVRPTAVVGLPSRVTAIAAGTDHTCALTTAGGVLCWGWNATGQLGNGTASDSAVPSAVVGLESGVAAIAAGAWHTCAVTTAGAVLCWGGNSFGALGDGSFTDKHVPVRVVGF
jgi:alpha-tubulin suppressor-like RCC1 family protein